MPRELALDPEKRGLYGAMLRPPPGYAFDAAIATTYSLDLETALAVPLGFTATAPERREDALSSPLALLEGLERNAGRIAVFCEAGRIQGHVHRQSRLCALLERTIVEVAAPAGGAFHPKLWLLRYGGTSAGLAPKLRLLILSRNLTRDNSWDLYVSLDGRIDRDRQTVNEPLVGLIKQLPDLATGPVSGQVAELVDDLGEALSRAIWEPPEPYESVTFAVNGLGGTPWQPPVGRQRAIIAPFCDAAALTALLRGNREGAQLIGRAEELVSLPAETLGRFEEVRVLDELATSEDGEDMAVETDQAIPLRGLHAKAFLTQRGWDTELTIGSGNATSPALLSGANVEVFATLRGKSSRVGAVEDQLGPNGLGRLLRPFELGEVEPPDAELQAAEERLEVVRRALALADLRLHCAPLGNRSEGLITMDLKAGNPISLPIAVEARVWPVTLGEGHSKDVGDLFRGRKVSLGELALRDVTRFLGFRLVDPATGTASLFALGAKLEGLPEERDVEILRAFINSRDAFLRYLRLLLADLDDPFAAELRSGGAWEGKWGASADDTPLLEDMVRALIEGGDRLRDVDRLVQRLTERKREDQAAVVPVEFLELWSAFRSVLNEAPGPGHV